MKALLVLAKTPYHRTPYDQWLEGSGYYPIILSSPEYAPGYAHLECYAFPHFDHNPAVELKALALIRERGIDRLFARAESDVLRAGRLRSLAGLPGQDHDSALHFRDKGLMKQKAQAAGVPVPRFRLVDSVHDIQAFIDEEGFPIVMKPRMEGGSTGVAILDDQAAFEAYLAQGLAPQMMVERYVEGEMYHIDGLVVDGELRFIHPFKYVNGCLAFRDNEFSGTFTLDPANPDHPRLVAAARRVLDSLPLPPTTTFHCEMWISRQGEILLCEIASRTGGGMITPTVEHAFGFNLDREWLRASLGLEPQVGTELRAMAGGVVIPPQNLRLEALPAAPEPGYVRASDHTGVPGKTYHGGVKSGLYLAGYVVDGQGEAGVEAHMHAVAAWFAEHTLWSDPAGAAPGSAAAGERQLVYLEDYRYCYEYLPKAPGLRRVLVADRNHPARKTDLDPLHFFDEIHVMDSQDPRQVEALVARLAQRSTAWVLAASETMVELGGLLRNRLGVPGMGERQAILFRDKYLMKQHAKAAGLRVAEHALVDSLEEARDFAAAQGYPIVLKPRKGYGTADTWRVDSESALAGLWAEREPRGYLAEAFVDGKEYHVDSVVQGGKVVFTSVGEYLLPMLQCVLMQKIDGSFVYPEGSEEQYPVVAALRAYQERVVKAFGYRDGVCHNEYFVLADGSVVFSECAARIGGSNVISDSIEHTHGLNMFQAFVAAETGQIVQRGSPRPVFSGNVCFPTRKGRITHISRDEHFEDLPGLVKCRISGKPGDRMDAKGSTMTRAGYAIVASAELDRLHRILEAAYERFELQVEDAP